jgi:energy-coupling factor transporter ATP-binding protein EcfA2
VKPLIAIAGKSGSGKTTLAEAVASLYGIPHDSFAAPIRWALLELGMKAPHPRRLMQGIGTLVRDWNQDHFIELLALRHPDLFLTGLVIDDLRYENEFHWLRERGFTLVYLEGSFRPLMGEEAEHESEHALAADRLPFDLVLPAGSGLLARLEALTRLLGERLSDPVS